MPAIARWTSCQAIIPVGAAWVQSGHDGQSSPAPEATTNVPAVTRASVAAAATHADLGIAPADHDPRLARTATTAVIVVDAKNPNPTTRCSATVHGALWANTVTAPSAAWNSTNPAAIAAGAKAIRRVCDRQAVTAVSTTATVTTLTRYRCDCSSNALYW